VTFTGAVENERQEPDAERQSGDAAMTALPEVDIDWPIVRLFNPHPTKKRNTTVRTRNSTRMARTIQDPMQAVLVSFYTLLAGHLGCG
jgi:hypothetical protein